MFQWLTLELKEQSLSAGEAFLDDMHPTKKPIPLLQRINRCCIGVRLARIQIVGKDQSAHQWKTQRQI